MTRSASSEKKKPLPQGSAAWWARNVAGLIVLLFIMFRVPGINMGYQWVFSGLLKGNLEVVRHNRNLTTEQRMAAKMGNDFAYLLYLRDNTPRDAVILWPTMDQFRRTPDGSPSLFRGNMCDKLSAVRWLYPRKVVVHEEFGKTSWGKRVTHVGVVNGYNRDLVPYAVDSTYVVGVLPMEYPDVKP